MGLNTTEVIAIVTGASALLAGAGTAALTSFFAARKAKRTTRIEAYELVASAAHASAFRASALGAGASTAGEALLDAAFEQMIAAIGIVHVRGSDAARQKAETLLAACEDYVNLARLPGSVNPPQMKQKVIDAFQGARREFLELARREEQRRRMPR